MRRLKRAATVAILSLMLGTCACRQTKVVMTVETETVQEHQALLYLALTVQEYEERAGKEIWQMRIGGISAFDAASEAALESLIRNQTVLVNLHASQKTLTLEEEQLVEEAAGSLIRRIGEETLSRWGISSDEVRSYMEEDYWVYKFRSQMAYMPNEEEVDRQVEEHFVWYENVDVSEYMQKIWLDAIVIYCGQDMDGEWITYSEEGRQQQYEKALEAQEKLSGGMLFEKVKEEYSEEPVVQLAPPFTEGQVQSGGGNIFYKGQLERDLWEALFKIPVGQTSGILQSDSGYLIVKVLGFPQSGPADGEVYRKKLDEAREAYRQERMEEQTGKGIRTIIDQWREELTVTVDVDQWQAAVEKVRNLIEES